MVSGSDAGLLVFLVLAVVGIAWVMVYVVRYLATGDVVEADKTARKAAGNLVGLLSAMLGVGVALAIVVGLIVLIVRAAT